MRWGYPCCSCNFHWKTQTNILHTVLRFSVGKLYNYQKICCNVLLCLVYWFPPVFRLIFHWDKGHLTPGGFLCL